MYDDLECFFKKGYFSFIVWINVGLYWLVKCMVVMSCFDIVFIFMDIYIVYVYIFDKLSKKDE